VTFTVISFIVLLLQRGRYKVETLEDGVSRLTVHDVERDDSGDYVCTANNSVGVDSAFISLAVDCMPVCISINN